MNTIWRYANLSETLAGWDPECDRLLPHKVERFLALARLYHAEWQKRGYLRSP